jgi:hypothetical protein
MLILFSPVLSRKLVCGHKTPAYLNNGNVKKYASQPHSDGGGSHDCWTRKEADSHRDHGKLVATSDDPRLQCHEQA